MPVWLLLLGVVVSLLNGRTARAEDLALTQSCEAGFRRFLGMAVAGRLGGEIDNANIAVVKDRVHVELLGPTSRKIILLKRRAGAAPTARYFDVEAGEGASAEDVRTVAAALDEVFPQDPFVVSIDSFGAAPREDLPSLQEAWSEAGWRGVLHGLTRRTTGLTSLGYTVAVIVALAIGLTVSCVVLWCGAPPTGERESYR